MSRQQPIAQPSVAEVEQYARMQAQQQQAQIQMQLTAEMRAVAHELYVGFVRDEITRAGSPSGVQQDRLRELAMYACRFSPYVLATELPQMVQVKEWPKESADQKILTE